MISPGDALLMADCKAGMELTLMIAASALRGKKVFTMKRQTVIKTAFNMLCNIDLNWYIGFGLVKESNLASDQFIKIILVFSEGKKLTADPGPCSLG